MEVNLDITARMLQRLLAGTIKLAILAGLVTLPGIRTSPIGSLELCSLAGEPLWKLAA